jgi:hypothetical protein
VQHDLKCDGCGKSISTLITKPGDVVDVPVKAAVLRFRMTGGATVTALLVATFCSPACAASSFAG